MRMTERHDFREGRSRYETSTEGHHDHLINLRTGEVIEFQSEEIERLQAEVARRLGFKLMDHRLELYAKPHNNKKKNKTQKMLRGQNNNTNNKTTTPVLISIQWLLGKLGLP